jgi:dipeptidyl aminopeptidase/acylaminoacyl peptidase
MPAPHDFARIATASAPAFSRDGQRLYHLRDNGLPQLWVMDLDTGAARQLTSEDEKIAFLRRAPADDRLIYGFDRGGDERQQLMLLDPEAERPLPVKLTAAPAVIHDFGAWSPDGGRIAFAANSRNEADFDIFVQDLGSGDRRCVYQGTHIVTVAGWRTDGARLVAVADRGYADTSLLTIDPDTCQTHTVPAPPCSWQTVRWAADGRTVLALTDHADDYLRLCRVDPDTGTVSPVYAAPGRDVEGWATSPDLALLATIENDRGWSVLRVGPTEGDRPALDLPRGVVSDATFSPDGSRLAFTLSAPGRPSGIWLWEGGTSVRPLFCPDPAEAGIPADSLAAFELVGWNSFDGTHIPGWLALPRSPAPDAGYPAVIWVHGGPVGQARPNFRPDMQMLSAQGYAVLMPNVRGSSGYGRASCESDDTGKRLDSVADLAAGARWLRTHPQIDAAHIGVMGQSYGGFMVLSAITEYPELWKAAVDYYGIADFTTLLAATGPWRRSHRAAEYGDPERDAALFDRISPIHRVDRVTAPLLVLHGTRDPRVPIGESEQLVAALRERQQPVEYLVFDYAGHGFVRREDRQRAYTAVADFFDRRLK